MLPSDITHVVHVWRARLAESTDEQKTRALRSHVMRAERRRQEGTTLMASVYFGVTVEFAD